MWYDVNKTLSHNCLFNFVTGARGYGKTYASKKRVIKNFLRTGEQFIYLRRYKEELNKVNLFFSDITGEFPKDELTTKGKTFLINGKEAGFAIPLSTAKILKSVPFDKITTIIFDEFIIDKGTYRYLTDEVINFLEFYETVARMRDNVVVLFLSNAITFTNPYFLYFNLRKPERGIYKQEDILLQILTDSEFAEVKNKTRFGKIIKGTEYGQYAIENEFLRDNSEFIEKKTGFAKYYFGMTFKGEKLGVWIDRQVGRMYVSQDIDPSNKIMYAITQQDHKVNTMLIKSARSNMFLSYFIENYKLGLVYFEDMKMKNICYDIIRMFLM